MISVLLLIPKVLSADFCFLDSVLYDLIDLIQNSEIDYKS